ncbi:RBBP9/YdeN family alpha/beta hydrolase [Providencia vermicola]|uniref:Serine hydrolase family protein n=2 Tax=Providencia TaxID=586 RepID=A0AAI9I0N4_PROST|nr:MULTISPECIES: alpha/beta hydrolase [Providencia]ELR5045506.1 serine hydrolase family protein [Providencia rettgeri]ELR5036261.1 serine hydrolase family protein [Providencia stuartii]ELR5122532.1 serine hydrolase family protein [Providencia stuartii]ELR5143797.1 serine hydrolase family protein [Providencia stuartii]ELR5292825.1 serine hydrolase family protein [Providencia stuartii]
MSGENLQHENLNNKKVIIVHGYTASPEKNWFPWLKAQLEQCGASVFVPAMPDPQAPDPQRWLQFLLDANIKLDTNTVLIGHSLGCVSVLRFLAEQRQRVGGYIFVSGFTDEQKTLPELKPHTEFIFDYPYLKSLADYRVSVISNNDQIVSPQSSRTLADNLETEVITVENAGHFLDREGFCEFPLILALLKNWRC